MGTLAVCRLIDPGSDVGSQLSPVPVLGSASWIAFFVPDFGRTRDVVLSG